MAEFPSIHPFMIHPLFKGEIGSEGDSGKSSTMVSRALAGVKTYKLCSNEKFRNPIFQSTPIVCSALKISEEKF